MRKSITSVEASRACRATSDLYAVKPTVVMLAGVPDNCNWMSYESCRCMDCKSGEKARGKDNKWLVPVV